MVSNSQNNKFYKSDIDLDPITLVLKIYQDMVTMYHDAKNEVSKSRHSKAIAQMNTQTHRHTDIDTDTHVAVQSINYVIIPTFEL